MSKKLIIEIKHADVAAINKIQKDNKNMWGTEWSGGETNRLSGVVMAERLG